MDPTQPPTLIEFVANFPEFEQTPPAYVQAKIDSADRLLSQDAFGDLYFDAVSYHAAHLLAVSPYGQQNAVDPATPGQTSYSVYYKTHILPRVARRGMVL